MRHEILESAVLALSELGRLDQAEEIIDEFRDFIETRPITEPGEPPVYRYENIDDGWTRGAELESGFSSGRVRAELGYSRLATRDRATGEPLLGRAAHSGRAGATLSFSW